MESPRQVGWIEKELEKLFSGSPRRGKQRFLGQETRSWEVADVRVDTALEHLERTTAILKLAYEAYWDFVGSPPSDGSSHQIDEFDNVLDPLIPMDHERLLFSGAVRDAVSIVEVYLEDMAVHITPYLVEPSDKKQMEKALKGAFANHISGFLSVFHIDLRSREDWPQWCELRATRHLVTHNWGRINARYLDGGSRAHQNNQQADDRYNPRLPTGFGGTVRSGDQAIDNPIDLDLAYARSALELARRIVDDVEAALGTRVRREGIDWWSGDPYG